jgi:hypothetical protein
MATISGTLNRHAGRLVALQQHSPLPNAGPAIDSRRASVLLKAYVQFGTTFWLDTKTSRPIKRVACLPTDGLTVTESYTTLVLNGTVDAKKFERPK